MPRLAELVADAGVGFDTLPPQCMLHWHRELMFLLEGAVAPEDESGASHTFAQHDFFVVEQGACCSWNGRERVKKVYAIVGAA